jgi:DNA-directed RNA polymerase subunit RPC12/RpoP
MIGIGTKKGLGLKESDENYKDSSMEEEDMKEDSSEDKMITCEKCGHKMSYSKEDESE